VTKIVFAVDIDAPAQRVFNAVVDWRGQDLWIPFTTVRPGKQAGIAVGGEIAAVTGIGPLAVLDTMTITRWEIPTRVDVLHTGRIVRGIGIMRVEQLSDQKSRFYWAEDLDLPLGVLGQVGWLAIKPAFALGMRASLKKFAELVESGELGTKITAEGMPTQ